MGKTVSKTGKNSDFPFKTPSFLKFWTVLGWEIQPNAQNIANIRLNRGEFPVLLKNGNKRGILTKKASVWGEDDDGL